MSINLGAHISIKNGIVNLPIKSQEIGGNIFQFFSKSPRSRNRKQLTETDIETFKKNIKKYQQKRHYIHAPYYINLASKDNRIRWGSISALKDELKISDTLNSVGVITHLGSAKDYTMKEALEKVVKSIKHILEDYNGKSYLILEQSAGAGGENGIIGGKIEDLGYIYKNMGKYKSKIKFCIDTCHAFAMGYNFNNEKQTDEYISQIDQHLSLKNLIVIHLNDSKFDLNSHKDRHANIGEGYIKKQGFEMFLKNKKISNKDFILETPTDKIKRDIAVVKKLIS